MLTILQALDWVSRGGYIFSADFFHLCPFLNYPNSTLLRLMVFFITCNTLDFYDHDPVYDKLLIRINGSNTFKISIHFSR